MEGSMNLNLWSDEDRLFIPRMLGWSINFKYIARKLGWIKPSMSPKGVEDADLPVDTPETSEDRLRRSVENSRFEDR